MRSRRLAGALAALCAPVLWSCGSDEPAQTPVACDSGVGEYLAALEAAPSEVRLDQTTAISDCLVEEQQPGELATFGESVVAAATQLNREIRRDPERETIVRLGYLVGEVDQGASDTGGIHRDLRLRLNAAARFTGGGKPPGAAFERAFGEGYAAAQEDG